MRGAIVLALAAAAGCAQTVGFRECNVDSDCPVPDGGNPLYCTSDHLCVDGLPDEKLCPTSLIYPPNVTNATRVGAIFRLADPSVPIKDQVKDAQRVSAVQFAVDGINTRVAASQPYQVVFCDSGGAGANDNLRAYAKLVQTYHVGGIVGMPTSGGVKDVSAALPRDLTLLISPAATVVGLADGNFVFRTCPTDDLQVAAFVHLVGLVAGTPKIAAAYSHGSQAKELHSMFKTTLGKPVSPDVKLDETLPDPYTPAAQTIVAAQPDIVMIFADSDIPPLLLAMAKAGAAATPPWPKPGAQIMLPFTGKSSRLVADSAVEAPLLPIIVGLEPAVTASVPYTDLFTQMQLKGLVSSGGYNTTFVPETFDAMFILLAAVEANGRTQDGSKLAASVKLLEGAGGMPVGGEPDQFQSIVSAMQKGMTIDLTGASGPIKFTASGDLATRTLGIWKIDIPTTTGGAGVGTAFNSLPLP